MIGFRQATLHCTLLSLLILVGSCTRSGNRSPLPVLSSCDQIRRLPAAEARRGYPVRLHGTVTFYDAKYRILTVQDESGGVLVDTRNLELDNVVPGVRLDVEGFSGYEEYDPVVVKPRIRVGPPTLLPAARKVPVERVLEGREDFQYVEVAARFKSISVVDNVHYRVVLETRGRILEAIVSTEESMLSLPAGTAVVARGVTEDRGHAAGHPRSGRLHMLHFMDLQLSGPAPAPGAAAVSAGAGLPLLTNLAQIKRLTPEQAAQGYPVRVRAVLNISAEPSGTAYVQDSTDGIYVVLKQAPPPFLAQGTQVEVEGVSDPCDFAPCIHEAAIRALSPGDPLSPIVISSPLGIAERDENKWARIRGVARGTRSLANSAMQIDLEVGGQHFPVDILGGWSRDTSPPWIDAELEIEGVIGALFNQNRQLQGFDLIAPSEKFIKVTLPPPPDPFARSESPLLSLFQFRLEDSPRHRVKVAGTVTSAGSWRFPGASGRQSGSCRLPAARRQAARARKCRTARAG